MGVSYEDEIDPKVRDQWLAQHDMLDLSMSEQDRSERYIKFKDVTFGVALEEEWPQMMRDLLELEHGIAGSQQSIGRTRSFKFHIQLHNNSKFFHRAFPNKREQSEFIKAEMKSWTEKEIVEPVAGVKCASSVVLVG